MTSQKLLVTGACGKLGSQALPALRASYEVYPTDKALAVADVEHYRQSDITDFAAVDQVMHGMDAVVHLAIASKREFTGCAVSESRVDPFDEMTLNVNVQGSYNVFEAARRSGVKKIVYLSSFTVHLGNRHRLLYDKDTPLEPRDLYACSKIFGENLGQLYARKYGMSIICLRIGQPFPSGTPEDEVWRSTKRVRSVCVALEDVNQAILCALRTDVAFGIYNIVSASDNPRIDLSHAREIGYVPRGFFSEAGLSFHDDGAYPKVTGDIVTH